MPGQAVAGPPRAEVNRMRTISFWIAGRVRIDVALGEILRRYSLAARSVSERAGKLSALVTLAVFICGVSLAGAQRPGGFVPLGPGGGGAMFHPTISPRDPNTVLVACDMTGAYITHDGGQSWRMFNLRGVVRFFVFDPIDAKTIYAATDVLWRSTDNGETWKLVYPKPSAVKNIRMSADHASETIIADPDPLGTIEALGIDPENDRLLYAAAGNGQRTSIFMSRDGGDSWQEVNKIDGKVLRIWVDPRSAKDERTLLIALPRAIAIRNSGGLRAFPTGFEVRDVAAGFGADDKAVLYAVSPDGLHVSGDGGQSWHVSELPGSGAKIRAVAASFDHPEIAYASFSQLDEENGLLSRLFGKPQKWLGVAKATDAGKTWQFAWKASNELPANVHDAWITQQFGVGWAENPLALDVSPSNPNILYSTDFGRAMKSTDGGATWTAVYSRKGAGGGWTSTGLDVTTSYGIHFDPFDVRRQFITYTDIGLFRSDDGGRSWESSSSGIPQEWKNTAYWVVFDPTVPGRMWSANSGTHDLPRPKMWKHESVPDYRGGVCRSDDGGMTWAKSNAGMPETAVTHILLDRRSPEGARTLYAAAFGRGVYKSIDGGKNWTLKNGGIAQSQPLAWRMAEDSSGTLYVILARRSDDGSIGNDGDGAIYRSRDGAEHWEPIALPTGVNGPNGLAIDPENPSRLYLAAWGRAAGLHGDGGGIFLSSDGGKHWRQVLDRDRHVYDVTINPHNPRVLYAAGFESSAWISTDRGEHWRRIAGFNFKWAHRVIPDPADRNSVYISTFGGSVWHGRVDGRAGVEDIATRQLQPERPDERARPAK